MEKNKIKKKILEKEQKVYVVVDENEREIA